MFHRIKNMLWREAPIPLTREPLPPISAKDMALAEEEQPITRDDIEACIRAIQEHAAGRRQPRIGPDPTLFFLALQQAEKFALECLEFGPARTHNVKRHRLDRAFTIWARSQFFSSVDESAFAEAMVSVLSWQGGHATDTVYMGVRIVSRVAESLSRPGDGVKGTGRIIDASPNS